MRCPCHTGSAGGIVLERQGRLTDRVIGWQAGEVSRARLRLRGMMRVCDVLCQYGGLQANGGLDLQPAVSTTRLEEDRTSSRRGCPPNRAL